jgi:3-hydroxyacyl-[acyl-carrier-protein] dehydratase
MPQETALAYNNKFAGNKAPPQGRCVRCDGERTMILDVNDIQKLLPHRYPFLMIDGILEMERLKSIVGVKNVTINEHFFQGHFPGKPIMPGVLIIEAMAQTGGLLLLTEIPDRESKLLYFVAVDNARFRRPVVPGDQLRLEVKVLHWRGGDFAKLEGKATVDGQVAAEATLMCKMVDREPKPTAAKAKSSSPSDEPKAEQPKA